MLQAIGPIWFRDPMAGAAFIPGFWAHALHKIGGVIGILFDVLIPIFQPMIPPAQCLLQKANPWFGHSKMRIFMYPGAHDAFHRGLQIFHQMRHGILIGIAPPPYREGRRFNRRIVFTD